MITGCLWFPEPPAMWLSGRACDRHGHGEMLDEVGEGVKSVVFDGRPARIAFGIHQADEAPVTDDRRETRRTATGDGCCGGSPVAPRSTNLIRWRR